MPANLKFLIYYTFVKPSVRSSDFVVLTRFGFSIIAKAWTFNYPFPFPLPDVVIVVVLLRNSKKTELGIEYVKTPFGFRLFYTTTVVADRIVRKLHAKIVSKRFIET